VQVSPEVFARTRAAVERYVWEREGWLDSYVSLFHFHQELAAALSIDDELVPHLVEAELQVERDVLRPLPRAVLLAERACRAGIRLAFTSDTYLPAEFIQEQLHRHGLWQDGAALLVSSEVARSKVSGRLYQDLTRSFDTAPSRIVHIGDNPWSDGASARRAGLRAVIQSDGPLNRYESLLAEDRWQSNGLALAFAGASRLARLAGHGDSPSRAAIRTVAAGVGGPAIVGYVLWLLRRAAATGVKRVYFLARDGQVMTQVASILIDRLGLRIEARYLFVSRRSTNLAATVGPSAEELGWIARDLPDLTLREALQRLDVEWEEVREHVEDIAEPDRRGLSPSDQRELLHRIQHGDLREIVLSRAERARALTLAYLRDQGLLDGVPAALVDIGGVGSQIAAVWSLVESHGGGRLGAFLVGLDAPEEAGLRRPTAEPAWLEGTATYLYDHRRRRGLQQFRGLVSCYQMFCAADHGTVLGYAGREPVLDPASPSIDLQRWGLEVMREAILDVARGIDLDDDMIDVDGDMRASVARVITCFWHEPEPDEVVVWGGFPFEGAQAASQPRPLIEGYGWRTVAAQVRAGDYPDLSWQHWHEGAVATSPLPLRVVLRAGDRLYRSLETSRHPATRAVADIARRLLRR
jgi:FMN phosphatase YigB (HAD superfamily)